LGDITADLGVGAAVIHAAPASPAVLGLIEEEPGAAGAVFDSVDPVPGEQLVGGMGDRPLDDAQVGPGPVQLAAHGCGGEVGVVDGVSDGFPKLVPAGCGEGLTAGDVGEAYVATIGVPRERRES
jgi:hypothetical protein